MWWVSDGLNGRSEMGQPTSLAQHSPIPHYLPCHLASLMSCNSLRRRAAHWSECKASTAAASDYCLRSSEVRGFGSVKGQCGWRVAGCNPLCSSWQGLTSAHPPLPNPGPGNAPSLGLETVFLCFGMILLYNQGCNKLFSSNSPKAELNILWGSIQMFCRAAAASQGTRPVSASHAVSTCRMLASSFLHSMCTCDGQDLGRPQEMLSLGLFLFFNPIWVSSFAVFLHISCAMLIRYCSGLLIRVSGRGRSNGLQEPKYIIAMLLSLSTKFVISMKN